MKRRRNNAPHLPHWDYRSPGYYFITFCTKDRVQFFRHEPITTYLSETWQRIPTWKNFSHYEIDAFVVMPDHFHAILHIATHNPSLQLAPAGKVDPGSISAAVAAFKSTTSRQLRSRFDEFQPDQRIWQRGYHESIIRSERSLERVRKYIALNPIRWAEDKDDYDAVINNMVYHAH